MEEKVFRDLIRKKKELSKEECIHILKTEKRGVLSVNGDHGYPYGMPMNHWYNEEDGMIYFHCGKIGHRLEALQKDDDWAVRVNSKKVADSLKNKK